MQPDLPHVSELAGGLAAVKLHVPVAHVEAGMRSFNNNFASSPYPQNGENDFFSELSILDALFNLGLKATQKILQTS